MRTITTSQEHGNARNNQADVRAAGDTDGVPIWRVVCVAAIADEDPTGVQHYNFSASLLDANADGTVPCSGKVQAQTYL